MIAEAFAGELIKFGRNRTAAFWSFQFAPLVALVTGLAGEVFARAHGGLALPGLNTGAALGRQALSAFAQSAGPLTELLCLVAVAALFAAEHQWETWRLVVTRQPRATVLLAKAAVYVLGCVAATGAIGLAGVAAGLFGRLIDHASLSLADPELWRLVPRILGAWAASVLQLAQLGAVAAAAAIVFRSAVATILLPLLLAAAQLFLISRLSPEAQLHPTAGLLFGLPGEAARVLMMWIVGGAEAGGTVIGGATAALAAAGLATWTVVGFGLGIAVFGRRDLARG